MIGRTFSHYLIERELGSGSTGVVYEARDTRLPRRVAMKFLHEDIAADPQILKRFEHEARAAAGLSHPNIVTIYDLDEVAGQRFLIFEYVDGPSLSETLRRQGPLPIDEVIRIGTGIARGLQHAHARGVIHRDIKSSNIHVTPDGTVKILDFGFAYLTDATRITRPGFTVGTLAYMSPEQLRAEEVDERTDLWSLGVVLYEAASGQLPYKQGPTLQALAKVFDQPPPRLTRLGIFVSKEFEALVLRCLERDLRDRWGTAAQVLEGLARLS